MSNRKYTFVRFKDKSTGNEFGSWWFVAKTIEDVAEHTNKFFNPVMQTGLDTNVSKSVKTIMHKWFNDADPNHFSHPESNAESAIQIEAHLKYKDLNPYSMSMAANHLYKTVVEGRMKDVQKRNLYLSPDVIEFAYTEDNQLFEICETIETEELEYPTEPCLIDNVRYIKWPGGIHWYAKLGNEDITDYMGNQKWFTKKDAEKAALWYIKNHYQHKLKTK